VEEQRQPVAFRNNPETGKLERVDAAQEKERLREKYRLAAETGAQAPPEFAHLLLLLGSDEEA
jgi:hypothetical protein